MIEQIISYETAKLAKEKGFNKDVYKCYDPEYGKEGEAVDHDESQEVILGGYDLLGKCPEPLFPAPTQSLLQKWLREEHNMGIIINEELRRVANDNVISIYTADLKYSSGRNIFNHYVRTYTPKTDKSVPVIFKTYEETLEEGLLEALKLI